MYGNLFKIAEICNSMPHPWIHELRCLFATWYIVW